MRQIYFDNAASTKVDERVLEAMKPYFTEKYANASSVHEKGLEAKKALEDILKRYNGTVLTPRSANDTDIALAAWNRLDTLNLNTNGTFSEQRITDFINRWRNKGPEFIPGDGGGKTY